MKEPLVTGLETDRALILTAQAWLKGRIALVNLKGFANKWRDRIMIVYQKIGQKEGAGFCVFFIGKD